MRKASILNIQKHIKPSVEVVALDCHINDEAFIQAVLSVFDDWVAKSIIKK
jgi:uncharacterized protein (UPF0261 family)